MPHCKQSFDSALKLLFHRQDAHGIPLPKKQRLRKREECRPVRDILEVDFKVRKRPRGESEEFQPVRGKRQRQGYEKDEPEIKEELMEFSFITTNILDRVFLQTARFDT
jgi:hypothetical protein